MGFGSNTNYDSPESMSSLAGQLQERKAGKEVVGLLTSGNRASQLGRDFGIEVSGNENVSEKCVYI